MGTYSPCWVASPSLDAVGRGLVLPQLDVPGFIDAHGRPCPFLNRGGVEGGIKEGGKRKLKERREGKQIRL